MYFDEMHRRNDVIGEVWFSNRNLYCSIMDEEMRKDERIRVLAMLPSCPPKQLQSLVLQDWEKLSEGERHFVKCLGPVVFLGRHIYHLSHIYITHFTSTTFWINML